MGAHRPAAASQCIDRSTAMATSPHAITALRCNDRPSNEFRRSRDASRERPHPRTSDSPARRRRAKSKQSTKRNRQQPVSLHPRTTASPRLNSELPALVAGAAAGCCTYARLVDDIDDDGDLSSLLAVVDHHNAANLNVRVRLHLQTHGTSNDNDMVAAAWRWTPARRTSVSGRVVARRRRRRRAGLPVPR